MLYIRQNTWLASHSCYSAGSLLLQTSAGKQRMHMQVRLYSTRVAIAQQGLAALRATMPSGLVSLLMPSLWLPMLAGLCNAWPSVQFFDVGHAPPACRLSMTMLCQVTMVLSLTRLRTAVPTRMHKRKLQQHLLPANASNDPDTSTELFAKPL